MGNGFVATEILEKIPPRRFAGIVFRVMVNDYPPEKENTVGPKWNPKGTHAIYTSEDAEIAISEVRFNLDNQPRPVRGDLLLTLYEIDVEVAEVIDLADAETSLAKIGLSRDKLLGKDWMPGQSIGASVAWLGRGGLFVPSARGNGKNLVIYPSCAGQYRFESKMVRKMSVR